MGQASMGQTTGGNDNDAMEAHANSAVSNEYINSNDVFNSDRLFTGDIVTGYSMQEMMNHDPQL